MKLFGGDWKNVSMFMKCFHIYQTFPWLCNFIMLNKLLSTHRNFQTCQTFWFLGKFFMIWNYFMLLRSWSFSILIDFFYTDWIFPCLWHFYMPKQHFQISQKLEIFLCSWNVFVLVSFSILKPNASILIELSQTFRNFFHASWWFSMPLKISCYWIFSMLVELFHPYKNFSSLWNFSKLVRLFHAHRTCWWNFSC